MAARQRVLAAIFGALAVLGVAAASRAPWRAHPGMEGVLRVSLSARPDRVETCRTLSEAEQAARPAHMRQTEVCEGTAARYRLAVSLGGNRLLDEILTGGGARSDRPIRLLREYPLRPGSRHLVVTFERLDDDGDEEDDAEESAAESRRRGPEVVPPRLSLDTTVTLESARVLLVSYDPRRRALVALSSAQDP